MKRHRGLHRAGAPRPSSFGASPIVAATPAEGVSRLCRRAISLHRPDRGRAARRVSRSTPARRSRPARSAVLDGDAAARSRSATRRRRASPKWRRKLENLKAAMNRPRADRGAASRPSIARRPHSNCLASDYRPATKALCRRRRVQGDARSARKWRCARDQAALDEANRQVDAARMTSRSQEIDGAEAIAEAGARAARRSSTSASAGKSVVAPAAGVVQDVFFRPGEMVNAGQPVSALLPPENRKVRFYVAAGPARAKIQLGERVKVSCDGCADDLLGASSSSPAARNIRRR